MTFQDFLHILEIIMLSVLTTFLIIELIYYSKFIKLINGKLKVFNKWYEEHFGEEIENGKEN